MKISNGSGILIYLGFIVIMMCSCNKNQNDVDVTSFDIKLDNMFYELGIDIDKDCLLLEELLKNDLDNLKHRTSSYEQINNKFEKYNAYLVFVDSMSVATNKNIFFTEGQLNTEGLQFIERSNKLVNILKDNVKDKLLLDRIHLLLGVDDIKNGEGIYLNYLDYCYNGAPQKTFSYLIKSRKRDALLINRELLN